MKFDCSCVRSTRGWEDFGQKKDGTYQNRKWRRKKRRLKRGRKDRNRTSWEHNNCTTTPWMNPRQLCFWRSVLASERRWDRQCAETRSGDPKWIDLLHIQASRKAPSAQQGCGAAYHRPPVARTMVANVVVISYRGITGAKTCTWAPQNATRTVNCAVSKVQSVHPLQKDTIVMQWSGRPPCDADGCPRWPHNSTMKGRDMRRGGVCLRRKKHKNKTKDSFLRPPESKLLFQNS